MLDSLLQRAERWADEDPDPRTAADLRALIMLARDGDHTAIEELTDAFAGTLSFGTAGLRGRMGPGSNRMNRVVVQRAAAGLADYLRSTGGHSIVIGFDARRHSDEFAHDTAAIMAGAGIATMVLPRPLPTPVLAFAIHHLGTSAGVMVTASHNPPQDNGYKVYLADGVQIVPPADGQIAACIDAVGPLAQVARSQDYVTLDDDVLQAYVDRAASLPAPGPRDLDVVSTALHGVGGEVFARVARAAGFATPRPVDDQQSPDPDFPTVSFPNPEEPGAMDLALDLARRTAPDLVIAHDPDADRCAAAVPVDDTWRMLTGDEVGALLGWWTVERLRRGGGVHGVLAESIVSGTLLQAIAADAGLPCATTLTGFKWIARVPGLVFGYEEALGYCVDPGGVTDKDGITAAILLMELAADLKAKNRRLTDVLDDLALRHGLHATSPLTFRVSDLAQIPSAMARLRTSPPTRLGDRAVVRIEDLAQGVDGLPPTDGIRLLMDDARAIVRPSGTEPKLKCYLQVIEPVETDRDRAAALAHARGRADIALAALRRDLAAALGLG